MLSQLKSKKITHLLYSIPLSGTFIVIPFMFDGSVFLILSSVMHFLAVYITIISFPIITKSLHRKPLYYEDLQTEIYINNKVEIYYHIVMSFVLSFLFVCLFQYIMNEKLTQKPISEILAIIGGNIGIYNRIQYFIGKIVLKFCHMKKINVNKEGKNDSDGITIEIV